MSDSEYVSEHTCPSCGSHRCTLYTDGHTFCHSCSAYSPGDDAGERQSVSPVKADLLQLHSQPRQVNRRITAETMVRWGVGLGYGRDALSPNVIVFPYRNAQGHVVAQKVRTIDKNFYTVGDFKSVVLFGQHLWRGTGSRIYVTEGEFDAMTIDQALGYRWPVVSLPSGASSARKALIQQLEYLNQYEKIVLCFDMDDPGREAVDDCVDLFKAGKVHILHLPLKDASDMMQADRTEELVKALWDAPVYTPVGLLSVADIREAANKPPEAGLPWFLPTLNEKTFGRRMGELVVVAAGAGTGKSTMLQQQAVYDMAVLKEPVAMFAFEQHPVETLQRIAGQTDGCFYHVWDANRDAAAFDRACDRLDPLLKIYDHLGNTEWSFVRERIRFLAHSGTRIFYVDNMTALCEQGDDERASIDAIIKEMANLTRELDIWICLVSHCASPEGKSHEEGGRITLKHLRGSRAMGIWPSFVIGLERDQQDPGSPTTIRGLKDRYLGRSLGPICETKYSHTTNQVTEFGRAPDLTNPF